MKIEIEIETKYNVGDVVYLHRMGEWHKARITSIFAEYSTIAEKAYPRYYLKGQNSAYEEFELLTYDEAVASMDAKTHAWREEQLEHLDGLKGQEV